MKALLLRIGVDKGTGGGLGPIYRDGAFDFVPIPENEETIEHRTFDDLTGSNGRPISEHLPQRYSSAHPHADPEFDTYTYGDPTINKRRQLKRLDPGDLLIFYAGLQPRDYGDDPRLYAIGYFSVEAVYEPEEMAQSDRQVLFEDLENNAHVKRTEMTAASPHPDKEGYPIFVKGDPDHSRLFRTARPLSGPSGAGGRNGYYMLDAVADTLGYDSTKDLTRSTGRWLNPTNMDDVIDWLRNPAMTLFDHGTEIRSYVIASDTGFAPNPSSGICSLATCKPKIRQNVDVGNWVIGTGARQQGDDDARLIYAMKVEETLSYDEYFFDDRFTFKRPDQSEGGRGDNIYFSSQRANTLTDGGASISAQSAIPAEVDVVRDAESGFVQLQGSGHGKSDIDRDTPKSPGDQAVIVSECFWYFGDHEVHLPEDESIRKELVKGYKKDGRRGQKIVGRTNTVERFVSWLTSNYRPGIHASPRDANNGHTGLSNCGC